MLCFGLKVTIGWTFWLHQTAAVATFKRTSSRGKWHQTRWIDLYCLLPSSSYIHCFLNCVYSGLCYSVDRPIGWIGKRSKAELSCLGWFMCFKGDTVTANKFTLYPNKIKSFGPIQLFMVFQGKMTMKRKSKSKNVKCGQKMKCPTKPPKKNEHKNE